MKKRFIRIFLIFAAMMLFGYGYYFYITEFTGDGKDTAKGALPTDAEYEWIEGPQSEKEHRYFFLSNGNFFGTGVVVKNLKGWTSGEGAYSPLPDPLDFNAVEAAYSDGEILFGLIKPNGKISVSVNDEEAERISLDGLSPEKLAIYNVQGYEIWYIDLAKVDNSENYIIKVLDQDNSVLDELAI